MPSFSDLPLLDTLQATLAELGLTAPTEIQDRALPHLLAGRSVVGVAETGSGKTLAWVLPVLDRLKRLEIAGEKLEEAGRPRALVLAPTRDLAEQVGRVIKAFTHATRLRVRMAIGGTTAEAGNRNVAGPFEVLVATPGRLGTLLDAGLVQLSDVRVLVLDEADQLVDHGFLPVVRRICGEAPKGCQLALFSATVPPPIEALIAEVFGAPIVIRTGGSHHVVPTLVTSNRPVEDGKRRPVLEAALAEPVDGGTLIFANTRDQADEIERILGELGRPCVVYRGEMDRVARRANLKAFRDGAVPILVTTDVGGRGLDIPHVARVINYHLPQELANYLHRVGRTARAGRPGLVINLVTPRDRPLVERLGTVAATPGKRR